VPPTPRTGTWTAGSGYGDPDATTERLPVRDDYSWGYAANRYPGPTQIAARLSVGTAIGTVLAIAGLGVTATGILAPEGFVIALFGVAFCLVGLAAGRKDGVAGRGLAAFSLVCGLAAVVLAVLAAGHSLAWPNTRVDAVAQAHAWVVAHWSWLDL
jgi:hypothetical protein